MFKEDLDEFKPNKNDNHVFFDAYSKLPVS